jgi:hypothetical protein
MGKAWTEEQKAAAKVAYAEKMQKVKEGKEPKIIDNNLLQKVETFNNESVPVIEERTGMNHWTDEDRINSIINTIRILPANLIVNGRHSMENVQALNKSFIVTDNLMDLAYENYEHDDYGQLVKVVK